MIDYTMYILERYMDDMFGNIREYSDELEYDCPE